MYCTCLCEVKEAAFKVRLLHNSYFSKDDGLFFSSKALGLVFSAPFDSAESFDLELFDLVVFDRLKTERLVAGHQSL